jgi:hypothetical protein
MKRIKWILIIPGLALLISTCKKNEDDPEIIEYPPLVTPTGTETGAPSIASIGPGGGSIISPDGKLELIFPGGALNSVTNISVQPVTNNAPGGIGTAYRFGPSGTLLNMPVTIKIHYTDNDISGSLPMFLGLAFQDADQIWYSLRNPDLDTVNKTLSFTSAKLFGGSPAPGKGNNVTAANFLDHATFLDLYIEPPSDYLKVTESREFKIYAIQNHISTNTGSKNIVDEDYLPALPRNHEISPTNVKQWSVNGVKNGNAEFGTVVPDGTACTYTAPGAVPSANPVNLTADLKLWYRDPETGADFNNLKLTAPIRIYDDRYAYQLKVSFKVDDWPAQFTWTLTDEATMNIDVIGSIVLITGIQNKDGVVSPAEQNNGGGIVNCTGTWLQGESKSGYINISGVTGELSFNQATETIMLDLTLTSSNATTPRFSYVCVTPQGTTTDFTGGGIIESRDYTYHFMLNNQTQIKNISQLTATLTPRNN